MVHPVLRTSPRVVIPRLLHRHAKQDRKSPAVPPAAKSPSRRRRQVLPFPANGTVLPECLDQMREAAFCNSSMRRDEDIRVETSD